MSRLKLLYIISLLLLGLLAAVTIFRPLATGADCSEVQRESLIKGDQEWVLQFDLVSREDGIPRTYLIQVDNDGQVFEDQVSLAGQKEYSYIQHIARHDGQDRSLDVAIFAQNRERPVEKLHYTLQ